MNRPHVLGSTRMFLAETCTSPVRVGRRASFHTCCAVDQKVAKGHPAVGELGNPKPFGVDRVRDYLGAGLRDQLGKTGQRLSLKVDGLGPLVGSLVVRPHRFAVHIQLTLRSPVRGLKSVGLVNGPFTGKRGSPQERGL